MKQPNIYMLVGLPASGKSSYMTKRAKPGDIVLSSDAIRAELFGDETIQSNNGMVFSTLHKRLADAMKAKEETIYIDATNISVGDRRKSLNIMRQNDKAQLVERVGDEVTLARHYKITAVVFNCNTKMLISRDIARERTVGEKVIWRMLTRFVQPSFSEGFDEIIAQPLPVKEGSKKFYQSLENYLIGTDSIKSVLQHDEYLSKSLDCDQTSQWHQESVREHLEMISELVTQYSEEKDLKILRLLTLFHDIGKPFTRNKKSENLKRRGYTHIGGAIFEKKNGTKVEVPSYDDYQFLGHENFGANIFRWDYADGLIKNDIITEEEAQLIEIIIKGHLEFHMNNGKSFIVLSGVQYTEDTEIFRLGTLFSFCDGKGRKGRNSGKEYLHDLSSIKD